MKFICFLHKFKKLISLFYLLLVIVSCTSYPKLTENDLVNENKPDREAFGRFLWSMKRDSTILIHKRNFDIIYKKSKKSNNKYFIDLSRYLTSLTTSRKKISKDLKISERAYIVGHIIIEYMYKIQKKFKDDDDEKKRKFIYRVLSPWGNNKYNREFLKHNYYGLPLLKKYHSEHMKWYQEDTIQMPRRIIH